MPQRTLSLGGAAFAALALAALLSPAAAQSTGAHPVMQYSADTVDVSALTFLTEKAKKALQETVDNMKDATLPRRAFAASADGKTWVDRVATKNSMQSLEDLARESLEACEYWDHAPCFLVALNGHDTRDATGTWPIQPAMLTHEPSLFDAGRIPFLPAADRSTARSYGTETGQRAFVVTPFGGSFWQTADTVFEAIQGAADDCHKANPNSEEDCILYAVNEHVVFAP